jgi:DMSO/TMAO reductase YedYZ molybdopterin-dependent catalytic subunit
MPISNWRGFAHGIVGGTLMILVLLGFRLLFSTLFLPEVLAEKIFATVPGELESIAVLVIGEYAKYSTLVVTTAIVVLIYSFYSIYYPKINVKIRLLGIFGSFLFFSFLPVPFHLTTAFLLGSRIIILGSSMITLLFSHLIYGLVIKLLFSFYKPGLDIQREEVKRTRRIFVRKVAPAAIGIAILIYGIDRFLLPSFNPPKLEYESLDDLYAKEVTPTEEFYRTDIALIPPNVNAQDWKLKVHGEVEQEIELNLEQLRSLPSVKEYVTLECISNTVGGPLVGTALWEGVRLSTILESAKLKSGARYVIFFCDDGYSVAIPIDTALAEGTMLALNMNEESINNIHGFPVRAVVPGIYGMMNAKWIRHIELVSEEYVGYWQSRGWSNSAEIETTSVIKIPNVEETLSGATPIAGIAFAGNRGISKVEVSLDGGNTWTNAMLRDPLSKYTWLLWSMEWIPKEDGERKIMVRATDNENRVQTSEIRATFPNGATGYHAIDVTVELSTNE